MLINGSYTKLLQPGLMEDLLSILEIRTGITEFMTGVAEVIRKSHPPADEYPPKDWPPEPEKWWEET